MELGSEQGAKQLVARRPASSLMGEAWGSHGERKMPPDALKLDVGTWQTPAGVLCILPICVASGIGNPTCVIESWSHGIMVGRFPDTVAYISFLKDLLKGSQERSEATFYIREGFRDASARVPQGMCRAFSHLERHFFGSGPVPSAP